MAGICRQCMAQFISRNALVKTLSVVLDGASIYQ